MAVDIAMTAVLPCLMAYSLIGETFHEAMGIVMLALFITHHILNRAWCKGLFRGRYGAYQTFVTAVDVLLFAVLICQPLSGIAMSKHLFTFLPTAGLSATARTVHLLLAYWGFVLMSLHLGLHIDAILKTKPKWLPFAAGAASLYGAYAFVKRELPLYMTLRSRFVFFDYAEPRIWFFADYLTIMVLFVTLGYGIGKALKGKSK